MQVLAGKGGPFDWDGQMWLLAADVHVGTFRSSVLCV